MSESTIARPVQSRLAWSVLAGSIVALPVGWLLATAAMLPFFLGLVFYMFFGLIVGAIVYRVSAPAAPIPRPLLWMIGLDLTLTITIVSLVSEYYNVRGYHIPWHGDQGWYWAAVPGDITKQVRDTFPRRSFVPEEVTRLRHETSQFFIDHLRDRYPPGGVIGYVRWVVANETLACPRVFSPNTEPFKPKQGGLKWIIRVILAVVLLGGTIQSQVLTLAAPPKPSEDVLASENRPTDKSP